MQRSIRCSRAGRRDRAVAEAAADAERFSLATRNELPPFPGPTATSCCSCYNSYFSVA